MCSNTADRLVQEYFNKNSKKKLIPFFVSRHMRQFFKKIVMVFEGGCALIQGGWSYEVQTRNIFSIIVRFLTLGGGVIDLSDGHER